MESIRKLMMAALTPPLVLAAVLLLTPGSAPAKPSDAAITSLSGNATLTRIYPPESGLRLLVDILNHVRSSPQLAMNSVQKQNLRIQTEEKTTEKKSPTDYRLAIKPRDVYAPASGARGTSSS